MNRPATIDGMPVMTSTKKVTALASLPRAVLDQVDRGEQADRGGDQGGEADLLQGADDARGRRRRPGSCVGTPAMEWVRK